MVGGGGDLVAKSYLTLVTPWTVAHQAPLSLGFSRQEYWSGLPRPLSGDLLNPGTKLASLMWLRLGASTAEGRGLNPWLWN